ncbi:hypothetical protein DOT_6087 [Desulfosporosinus sp. OT]|nr:hypothetical protein DOT_6087 [Desulfosporosinus sp. OT]
MEKKYHNFYAPAYEVLIENTDILQEGMELTDVMVENTVEGADSFSFTVNNAFDIVRKDFNWLDQYLSVGKKGRYKDGILRPSAICAFWIGNGGGYYFSCWRFSPGGSERSGHFPSDDEREQQLFLG